MLLRRPDVLQAEHQLIAQNANIGAARAALFPRISLTAALGTISTALSGLFGAGSELWSVAPSATLPLFDGGRNRGNLRLQRQRRSLPPSPPTSGRCRPRFARSPTRWPSAARSTSRSPRRSARANSAGVAARLSDARYRAGVDSFLVSLDAQRTAYAAQQQLVTTRRLRAANLVQLYRTLGGGLR